MHLTLDSHSEEALERFGQELAQIPELLEAFLVSGDYDHFLRLRSRTRGTTNGCCGNGSTRCRASATASPASCRGSSSGASCHRARVDVAPGPSA